MNEAVERCYKFITALYVEMEKLQGVKGDQQAYAMGQMKINITGYMMNLWENRAALDADFVAIGAVQQCLHPTDGGLCENCGEPLAAVSLHEYCFPPATIGG